MAKVSICENRLLDVFITERQEKLALAIPISEIAERLGVILRAKDRAFLVVSRGLRLEVVEIHYTEGFAQKIPGPHVAIAEMHKDVDFIDRVGLTFDGNQRLLDELSHNL
jgi:hypothetical protein